MMKISGVGCRVPVEESSMYQHTDTMAFCSLFGGGDLVGIKL